MAERLRRRHGTPSHGRDRRIPLALRVWHWHWQLGYLAVHWQSKLRLAAVLLATRYGYELKAAIVQVQGSSLGTPTGETQIVS